MQGNSINIDHCAASLCLQFYQMEKEHAFAGCSFLPMITSQTQLPLLPVREEDYASMAALNGKIKEFMVVP